MTGSSSPSTSSAGLSAREVPYAARTMSELLGEHTIEGVLGEGGSAIVYAARARAEPIALKVLRVDPLTTERQKARFLDEARLLAQVRHPNVVEVLGAGALPDGRPFIAMPRLTGETLAARVARGPLALAPALRLFEAIAHGVAAIHDAGLVHRDLKVENVFLIEEERPIVLDLGIAREAEAAPSTTTQDWAVRGTPATMAPERFFGARASAASDVYELALMLYVMLVGSLPWSDVGDVDARLSARPPHTLVDTIPRALSDAIMAALSTRIEKRPASVRALLASVREAATGEGGARRTRETRKRKGPSAALPAPPSSPRAEAASRGGAPRLEPPPASTARPHAPVVPRSTGARSRVALGAIVAAALGGVAAGVAWRTRGAPVLPPAPSESSADGVPASAAPTSSAEGVPASAAPMSSAALSAASIPTITAAPVALPVASSESLAAPASASAKAGSSAPVDPLAPCRALVDLLCHPDLEDVTYCPAARDNLRAAQSVAPEQQRSEGELCEVRLTREAKALKEQIDRLNGRPTAHLGETSDAALDARFPGCAYYRREACMRYGEGTVGCKTVLDLIETRVNGTAAQQLSLRGLCAGNAALERSQREKLAKRRGGGAPSANVSPKSAP